VSVIDLLTTLIVKLERSVGCVSVTLYDGVSRLLDYMNVDLGIWFLSL